MKYASMTLTHLRHKARESTRCQRIATHACQWMGASTLALALGVAPGLAHSDTASTAQPPLADATATAQAPLTADFQRDVSPQLIVPPDERIAYAMRLQAAFVTAQVRTESQQFVVLIDRNSNVQAALLYWGSTDNAWQLIGATPVSTGLPGRYEHFTTPLGVFDHSMANPDFRAEGTRNKLGFRGYGAKGMRVYDFGWVDAPRGWGNGAQGVMRLQMHATDPALAEFKLGTAQSQGCVRIPASLNDFIDRHGLLDAAYEKSLADGTRLWVLRTDRTPTPWAGRYLVVIDSDRTARPAWSLLPLTH